MKLLDSFGPNPRAVRMFLAEKGLEIPSDELDLLGGENRKAPYTNKNPGGQMPALELDNGQTIGETVAIFEYLEEKNPTPALIGSTPEERAETRMWQRRVELGITENIYNGFRYSEGIELFKDRLRCLPEAADGLKAKAQDGLKWLDNLMEGKDYIAGDRFTVVDIILFCCTDFSAGVGQTIDPALKNLTAWKARVEARPSATSSLHPNVAQVGMRG
ncbi:MAG: glutathione S-transferase family protein [Rhodospirillales bacterium]|nr:glutathione S-transferase family protein [Rhodospirillales bacterium]